MRIFSFAGLFLVATSSFSPAASADSRFPQCVTGPFYVFFHWNSSEIADDGIAVIEQIIVAKTWCGPNVTILVDGYADRSQDNRASKEISKARANAVAMLLQDRGVSKSVLKEKGYGEARPRISIDNGVREVQNRRVEIRIVLSENK